MTTRARVLFPTRLTMIACCCTSLHFAGGGSPGTALSVSKISATAGVGFVDRLHSFGSGVTAIGDLDKDGVVDLMVGSVGSSTSPPILHILFMRSDGTAHAHRRISNGIGGLAAGTATLGSDFGQRLAGIGDLDQDGVPEVAVSEKGEEAVHILYLTGAGFVKRQTKLSAQGGVSQGGLALGTQGNFGESVVALGDIDGDGIPDIAASTPVDETDGYRKGALHILFMRTDGLVKSQQKISDSHGLFSAALSDQDRFGRHGMAALGDLDGDGVTELAVGAEGDDDGASNAGAVYILFLSSNGTVRSYRKISMTSGGLDASLLSANCGFGRDMAALGDVDGDHIVDLAVSAVFDDDGGINRGSVHILFMRADGSVKSQQKISAVYGGLGAAVLDNFDGFGSSVAALGDINGDGVLDMAVGAFQDDDGYSDFGALYIVFLRGVATNLPCGGNTSVAVPFDGIVRAVRTGVDIAFDTTVHLPCFALRNDYRGTVEFDCRCDRVADLLWSPCGGANASAVARPTAECVHAFKCHPAMRTAVTVGSKTVLLSPNARIDANQIEVVPCSRVNPGFTGSLDMKCIATRGPRRMMVKTTKSIYSFTAACLIYLTSFATFAGRGQYLRVQLRQPLHCRVRRIRLFSQPLLYRVDRRGYSSRMCEQLLRSISMARATTCSCLTLYSSHCTVNWWSLYKTC
jgi:hypothetical protein